MNDSETIELLAAARSGDRAAFDRLFAPGIPKLRGVLTRMVGHPDDVDDLCQQALLRAYEGLDGFAQRAAPSTWLCSIGARLAIDHLRGQRRYRERAQVVFAARAQQEAQIGADVHQALSDPDFAFDVRQHIAYCFTCVGRTLEPEAQAALVLRDVLQLSNEEAARAVGVSRAVLRHRLSDARQQMQSTFEGLCSLVNKQGVCWQCAGLRQAVPQGKGGPPPPDTLDFDGRLAVVRDAPLCTGSARALHEVFFRHTEVQEQQCLGDSDAETDCGKPQD